MHPPAKPYFPEPEAGEVLELLPEVPEPMEPEPDVPDMLDEEPEAPDVPLEPAAPPFLLDDALDFLALCFLVFFFVVAPVSELDAAPVEPAAEVSLPVAPAAEGELELPAPVAPVPPVAPAPEVPAPELEEPGDVLLPLLMPAPDELEDGLVLEPELEPELAPGVVEEEGPVVAEGLEDVVDDLLVSLLEPVAWASAIEETEATRTNDRDRIVVFNAMENSCG